MSQHIDLFNGFKISGEPLQVTAYRLSLFWYIRVHLEIITNKSLNIYEKKTFF